MVAWARTRNSAMCDTLPQLRTLDKGAAPADERLDAGIAPYVNILRAASIETYASCQGGLGHAYLEPTIRFHGEQSEGLRALAVALQHGLPVDKLGRIWVIIDGEPTGPHWELTFDASDSES